MTLTAAPFGTAVRTLRTAAGRRALQLALLLGGLLALGFLCGEQAHAAEGTPAVPVSSAHPRTGHENATTAEAPTIKALTNKAPTAKAATTEAEAAGTTTAKASSVTATTRTVTATTRTVTATTRTVTATTSSVTATAKSVTAPATEAGSVVAPDVEAAPVAERAVTSVRGVTDGTVVERAVTSVGAVTERVVAPVRTVVRETAGTLDTARATALPGSSSLPVPQLPGISDRLPVPQPPAPVTPEPRPDRHVGMAPAAGQAERPGAESAKHPGHRAAAPARPSAVTYGPDAGPSAAQAPAHIPARSAAAAAGAPAQRPTPPADPDGALGKQATDGTASRHGDAHAIALDGRAPLRLLPGTTARVDAPGTRERHRDIPLFPG
ncbi:hypothetical protein [Streptomyces sp. NPDC015414]|uniref:hypothetical protein n=1 Tax=Streptomyces sp. NPDC015414 TaxID=3364957 RepID=UPI0036F7B195